MRSYLRGLSMAGSGMLAFLLLGVFPVTADAAKVAFRNDGPTPIVVQGTIVVRGQVQRGKALQIQPGQSASYDQMPAGNASITVYDATQPNRVLFQGPLTVGTDNLYFSVKPDPPGPKAKLDPVKPPMPMGVDK